MKTRLRRRRRWIVRGAGLSLVLAAGVGLLAGCGKKGPPQPPLKRGPDRITNIAVAQRGNEAMLTGQLPERSQDGTPVKPIQEVRIFRLDRSLATGGIGGTGRAAQRATLRQFAKEAERVATLSGEELGRHLAGRKIIYVDPGPRAGAIPPEGRSLTYAMTVVDVEKRSSPLSALVPVRLLPPPLPPSNLQAEFSEKSIHLQWEPPAAPAAGEPLAYNVYRTEEPGRYLGRPRHEKPLPRPFFDEGDFVFGRTYHYVVRTVAEAKPADRESEDSLPLEVTPRDIYAPAAPTGLAVSAEAGVIKLYWFPNSEPDLGGYRIYRSEKETEDFLQIGTAGPGETTYSDPAVQPGVKYYYAVTAVDQAAPPNESERSEVHGDRLPPAPRKPAAGAASPGRK